MDVWGSQEERKHAGPGGKAILKRDAFARKTISANTVNGRLREALSPDTFRAEELKLKIRLGLFNKKRHCPNSGSVRSYQKISR